MMLHSIVQGSSAFESHQWFTVEPTLGRMCHDVVIAMSGAALCSCLETTRTGMLCRHIVACLPHVPVGTVGGGAEESDEDSRDDAGHNGAAAPARRQVAVTLTMAEGQGLGLIFDFFSGASDAVKVKQFVRSKAAPRVKLPAEASGLILIGDVITAIDGAPLRCLSTDSAKAVIQTARTASPMQTILTVLRTSCAGGCSANTDALSSITSSAAAAGNRRMHVARPIALAVFRNTQRRWLRPSVDLTAFCITNGDGQEVVLAKVVALAAQRYAAAAGGVVTASANSDEAVAPEALPDNASVIHANVFALFRKLCQDLKAVPRHQALQLAKDLCKIGRDRIDGVVHDPLVVHKRSHKPLKKRAKDSSRGRISKKLR
ncbi:hypothetical protein JKP88DRAFT_238267 [Tribonema minus]|uniref:SWIM-type domain-containing protein n=1 Tax=Tribonema minus TaxID=303371 RepID=A0A836CF93_9STRA|nr:hypothetical protein JKP88DRAFT_238267 [Tribonema minus]